MAGSAADPDPTLARLLAILGTALCGIGALARRLQLAALLAASFFLGFTRLLEERVAAQGAGLAGLLNGDTSDARERDVLVAAVGDVEGLPTQTDATPIDPAHAGAPGDGSPFTGFDMRLVGFESGGRLVRARGAVRVRAVGVVGIELTGARVRVIGRWKRDGRLVTRAANITILEIPTFGSWAMETLRARALLRLRERFEGGPLGVAAALVLGTYAHMPRDLLDAYTATGALPFLSISGLHVAIVAGAFQWFLGRASPRRRRAALLWGVLGAYACFVGNAAPVVRSMVGFCFLATGQAIGRPSGGIAALAMAMAAELCVRPDQGLTAGFQLSYGAVLAFLFFLRPVDAAFARFLPEARAGPTAGLFRWLRLSLAMTVVASLATAGVTTLHFGEVAPMTLLVSVPLSVVIPPLMLFSWGALLPGWAGAVCAAVFVGIDVLERALVMGASRLPWTPIFLNPWLAPSISLAGLGLLLGFRGAFRWGAASAALAVVCWGLRPEPSTGRLEIWIHSVQHGLAVTLIFPDGSAAQVDAGSRDDPGLVRSTLAPALWKLGIARFAAVSLSHDDSDHANGYADLLLRFPADRAITRPGTIWKSAFGAVRADGRLASARLELGGARAEWFAVEPGPTAKTNDREVVAIVTYAGRSVLFPGDLESDGVEALLRRCPDLPLDLLVLPHHGLDNGQLARLLDATHPALALVSNGDRYSTRSGERKARARGIPFLATRDLGTLRAQVFADGSVVVTRNPTIGWIPDTQEQEPEKKTGR